jgi:hypothetical protein
LGIVFPPYVYDRITLERGSDGAATAHERMDAPAAYPAWLDMLAPGRRLQRKEGVRMAFPFKLETPEGVPAEPPTLSSAVPN